MGLSCRQLASKRGHERLFSGVSFALAPGEAIWVQGDNGSGKTTLLRQLCGLALPERGTVCWQGQPISAVRADYHASLLYIGHADGLKGDLLAWENLLLGPHGQGRPQQAALDALAAMGLSNQAARPVRLLSQGQRKRVALARLLLAEQQAVWILDEPFSALDQPSTATLRATLAQHRARGGMLVLTTHQDPELPGLQRLRLGQSGEAAC